MESIYGAGFWSSRACVMGIRPVVTGKGTTNTGLQPFATGLRLTVTD